MPKLEAIVAELPEWQRVDIEAWEGEPTFRVGKKKAGRLLDGRSRPVVHLWNRCPRTGLKATVPAPSLGTIAPVLMTTLALTH